MNASDQRIDTALRSLAGKGGLGAFAPPLDRAGNSVKGQSAAKFLSRRLGLDLFLGQGVPERLVQGGLRRVQDVRELRVGVVRERSRPRRLRYPLDRAMAGTISSAAMRGGT